MIMREPMEKLGSLVVGLYAWVITAFFGAVLLDVVYANVTPGAAAAFSEAADFLLLVGAVTVLAALGAIGLSWNSRVARILFIASLLIIALEFLAPAFLSSFLRDVGSAWGTGIRITINGLASVLAFIGLYEFYRQETRKP